MALKSIDAWAVPTLAGTPNIWGPWYGSDIIITTPGKSATLSLNFETISDAPSNYTVQLRYWQDGKLIIREEPIAGDGSVDVKIGGDAAGSIGQVYFRLQSSSLGQIVTVQSDEIGFQPISPPEENPIQYETGGAFDKYYIDSTGQLKGLPPLTYPDFPKLNLPSHLGDVRPNIGLPDFLSPVPGLFNDVPAIPIRGGWGDPLVLDLDGDGIEVSKMGYGAGASTTYFDMDNDGFAERTAWVKGGDGLLALDKNGNGKIDNQGELFGNNNVVADGFTNLKTLDSNNDYKITAADAQFANLRVWVDANADGKTDAGELKTLAELKITQINLAATILTGVTNNENTVAATSSFVMNGTTKTMSEVWFRNDTTDTHYLGDTTLDVRTLFLPTLKGFGNLKDLHVANDNQKYSGVFLRRMYEVRLAG